MTTRSHGSHSAFLSEQAFQGVNSPKNWRQSSRKHRPSTEKEKRIVTVVKAAISSESDFTMEFCLFRKRNDTLSSVISKHFLFFTLERFLTMALFKNSCLERPCYNHHRHHHRHHNHHYYFYYCWQETTM